MNLIGPMPWRYLVRRLALFLPTLIVVSLLIFLGLRVLPGDVAEVMARGMEGGGGLSQQDISAIRQELGLNRPLYEQYVDWVADILQLDLGRSLRNGEPVTSQVKAALPVTFQLAVMATVIAFVIGVPLGVLAAVHHDSWLDNVVRTMGIAGVAMPVFWTGTLLLLTLALIFRWTPPLGSVGIFRDPFTGLLQLGFPSLVLGYYYAGVLSRMVRSSMLEVLYQDYIQTARAKGLAEVAVLTGHALRNALLPVVTVSGLQFAHLLGGAVIVEEIFGLPGVGKLLLNSIIWRDYPVVQGLVVLFTLWVLLTNFAVDLLYGWLDPRVRYT